MTSSVLPLRLRIPEAAEALRISRARLYEKIRDGQIRVVKDGRSTFILPDELRRYVERAV
jgi:excisionase family DNA binding protein